MPIVINDFEAVAANPDEGRGGQPAGGERPREIAPSVLRRPLAALAARRARVRAH